MDPREFPTSAQPPSPNTELDRVELISELQSAVEAGLACCGPGDLDYTEFQDCCRLDQCHTDI
ncbi:MAG: hypothetical protein AAGF71_04905 [Pseudomonadota bacterium]